MNDEILYLAAALVSFALCAVFSAALLPLLRRLKAGQTVLFYVDKHEGKSGTPTMGGIAFLLAASISVIAFSPSKVGKIAAAATLGYGLLGFLDDFIKVVMKRNLGLKAYQKIIGQLGISAILTAYGVLELDSGTVLRIPFTGIEADIGLWYIPLAMFVYVAAVNAVNLTDGLDGLAAGTGSVYFAVFGVICATAFSVGGEADDASLAAFSFALVGALAAFLWLNSNPAKVFMGDTGSLALGGAAASVAVFSGNALLLPLVGIMYVVSCISVIVQVLWFKRTGKRVFLMAPYHHHLEYKGIKENKIVAYYVIITAAAGALALLSDAIGYGAA